MEVKSSQCFFSQCDLSCFFGGIFKRDFWKKVDICPLLLRLENAEAVGLFYEFCAFLSIKAGFDGIEPAALEQLQNYDWPGNLRELHNEVTRMLIFAQDNVLGAELISRHILQAAPSESGADRSAEEVMTADGTLKDRIELIEMRILRETLTRNRWNKSRAAAELGLSRVGLRAKLDRYGIEHPAGRVQEEEED